MSTPPAVRVVVRLPWNRPENPIPDPPPIEWNDEKADTLWKVMARSRASDSGGTDWKGLAAHLQVPLPYLLFRAQTRFEEDLRGLQDIGGVLSPALAQPAEAFPPAARASSRMASSTRLAGSVARLTTPLGARARLSSIGSSPGTRRGASSTLTLPARRALRPASAASSGSASDSDAEDAAAEDDADRAAEAQAALERRLQDLQRMMTGDALGLVSARPASAPGSAAGSFRARDSQSQSASRSVSSTTSPQGSIPSIPSPPPESPLGRHLSPGKSGSPPAVSARSALGQAHRRYGPLVDRTVSDGSNQGSEASSFSDISDTSLSASALESALLSNGNASRLSTLARTGSRFLGRGGLTNQR